MDGFRTQREGAWQLGCPRGHIRARFLPTDFTYAAPLPGGPLVSNGTSLNQEASPKSLSSINVLANEWDPKGDHGNA